MRQTLRPYQSVAVESTHQSFHEGYKKTLLCMPTGSGKTTVVAHLIEDYLSQNLKILFVAHRRELVDQAHNRLAQHGIDAGLILPGYEMNGHKVNIASVQTLVRREIPQVDILIVDECHHSMAGSFLRIIGKCIDKGSKVLGLTATPFRLDGKPLGLIFDDLLVPTTVRELIDDGYLVQPRYFSASIKEDFGELHYLAGEYKSEELFKKFDRKALYDGLIRNYVEFGGGKGLVFNVNIEHSIKTRDAFREAGFTCEHIDHTTRNRGEIEKAFRSNQVEILCNVGLYGEGYDLPHLDTTMINTKTMSYVNFAQWIGRSLRPSEGKEHGIVIDQGNNIYEHGFIEDEIDYNFIHKYKKKGDRIAPIKLCPQCQSALHASVMKCGFCGYVYPKKEMELKDAVFEEIKESPKVCKKAKLPEHLRKPWGRMNNEELQEVATLRGYKKGWVWMQLNLQAKRRKLICA